MNSLSNPFDDDRIVKKVVPPPIFPLEHKLYFLKKTCLIGKS